MATQNPQRFELGGMLKRAREQAGLTSAKVEQELRWYAGKASRVELGTRVPVPAEIDRLADLYRLQQDQRETLHLLASAARRREPPARVADFAQTYVTLERAATDIAYFDAELVMGLVQTEAYAMAVLAASRSEHVEERVADRMRRQEILSRTGEQSVRLRAIFGEAVLHREVGGRDVLRGQLEHLLAMRTLPHVAIRILPFAAGAHRSMGVSFTILQLPAPGIARVYVEGLTDATYIHEERETRVYKEDFDHLWSVALDADESAAIIRRHIE